MVVQQETIIERIQADHEKIFERIAELERRGAGPRDETVKPVLAPLRTDLLAHMVAEEEYVYNFLEKEMRSWIENSRREHQTIRDHLAARGIRVEGAWFLKGDRQTGAAAANFRAEHAVFLLAR